MVTIRPLSRSLCRPLSRALVWLNDQARAYLLVDPAGADNSVLYMAKAAGAAGELVSVAYASPATQATTTVAVSTNAITVTPGTKARMVVSGVVSGGGAGTYTYSSMVGGKPSYLFGANYIYWEVSSGGYWYSSPSSGINMKSISAVDSPDLASGWIREDTLAAVPGYTVTAGVSSAAQVIAAVNASTPAAALVTASASGASTGPVAEVAAAFLTLIPANALTLDGEVLTLDGQILTLD